MKLESANDSIRVRRVAMGLACTFSLSLISNTVLADNPPQARKGQGDLTELSLEDRKSVV